MTGSIPDVSVVVPNLDGGARVVGALDSVFAQSGVEIEAILVDNASTDGSPSDVARAHPSVRILQNEVNTGFAPACNRGAADARGRYLLFLNNDAVLPADALGHLVAVADADPVAAIWQPVIESEAGEAESCGTLMTRAGFLWPLLEARAEDPYPVFTATAACVLVRRDVFESLGGFPAAYFAYFEDADLCWRARMSGWEVRVVPAVRVAHGRGVTTRRIFAPADIYYLGYRNRLRSLLANPSAPTLLYVVPLQLASCLLIAAGFLVAGRPGPAWSVLRALAWPLTHAGEVRRARRRAQSIRTRGDRDVLRRDLLVPLSPRRAKALFTGNLARWRD
jgi:GT2 family glycosyltransferase